MAARASSLNPKSAFPFDSAKNLKRRYANGWVSRGLCRKGGSVTSITFSR